MAEVQSAPVGGRVLARAGRLADRALPWLAGVLVFVLSVAAADSFLLDVQVWASPLLLSIAVVCGAVAGLGRWWRWPLFLVAAPAAVILLLWPVGMVACYYAGTRLRGLRLRLFVAGASACYVLSVLVNQALGGYRSDWALPVNAVLAMLLIVFLPLVVGLWVAARRQLLVELTDRADRAEAEQVIRAERARGAERARIAREMHDILAHRVSLMVLHAGAIEVTAADADIAAEAGLIRSTGREALTNLRETLGVLRTPGSAAATAPQPTLADLDALVEASRAAGVPVTRRTEGAAFDADESVQRTVYRVVQEALTNVHKHAGRAATEVLLAYRPGRLVVEVTNEPPPAPVPPPAASGLGLLGLTERVELAGGSCVTGARPDGGFVLRAELPVTGLDRERCA